MSELSGTNLDLVFILIGLAVWARLIVYYASRRPYLRIEPRPDPAGIAFGPEAVLGVLLVFLFVVQVIHTVLEMARGTASDLELSNQVLADILGKTVAIGVMIGIFYSGWYQREILFPTPPVHKKTVLGLSLLIYFAIYPLVNVLLLSLGITVFPACVPLHRPGYPRGIHATGGSDDAGGAQGQPDPAGSIDIARGRGAFFPRIDPESPAAGFSPGLARDHPDRIALRLDPHPSVSAHARPVDARDYSRLELLPLPDPGGPGSDPSVVQRGVSDPLVDGRGGVTFRLFFR